jgi:hypothetical protein
MWPEPLTARTVPTGRFTVDVVAVAGDGRTVAVVSCAHNAAAGWGIFGEMRIVADDGGPRQRVRALVLLVREALRYAEQIAVTHVRTEAPSRLEAFAARMCGIAPDRPSPERRTFAGELQAARTAALAASDADGRLRDITPEGEEEIDGAVRLRR